MPVEPRFAATPSRLAIFVLEDEAIIRMMIVDMIEELGHRVVAEAGSLQDAIALAKTAEFDLALLDVNIKGDTSVEVATIVDQRQLPFIFITGYGSTALPAPFDDHRILQKPFPLESLRHAISLTVKS